MSSTMTSTMLPRLLLQSAVRPVLRPLPAAARSARAVPLYRAFSATALRRDDAAAAAAAAAAGPDETDFASATDATPMKKLTREQHQLLNEILRVDQAGEIGANFIYKGQMAVLGRDPKVGPLLHHMWEQEVVHLDKFNELIPQWRARPSLLYPLWEAAGYAVGVGSALLGKEAAMACTEAVETVIGSHYNDQIRALLQLLDEPGSENLERRDEIERLVETLQKFRDDELEHLHTAVEHDAGKAPMHGVFTAVVQGGCKLAIEVAKKL
ncbi:hypothetical protein AMAG_07174 [Allomyces macrogynus ATCC 38327]|uniref:5-demethoxyubiquinone hydroxylase, mitochondrial n=1 Tax=Allomyces macrogynus (strain ATCC 38327) TaxID=578462 RepID=A0A0L0SHN8_ALLM3|nr:hypothetical protein AMAG_07174 [Allomyces macrogynus ATCC 38327]|eukprot:KNE61905.1 hypothetical protein AMAG_07174 [Allomyces macrogynus ATCC 38327]